MSVTRIGLLGAKGRMGREVATLLSTEFRKTTELIAAVDQGDSFDSLAWTDAVIDFSAPEAVLKLCEAFLSRPDPLPALILGSTGWNLDGRAVLRKLAERTPIVLSSNFSPGVLLVLEMLREYSPLFDKFGYTPVIVESHHKHKKDAPSGTALSLQRVVCPAGPGNVQTHAVRAGEVVGDHTVTFYGHGDRITVGHFAQDRSIFARGAIDAAIWLAGRRSGPEPLRGLLGMDTYFKEKRQA